MTTQRWTVGRCTITSILEEQIEHIPPELFFPDATAADVARHPWLVPDFADEDGRIALRVQALVIETGGRTVLIGAAPPVLQSLAAPVLAASVGEGSCGVYWRESGGVDAVELIRQALESWAGELRQ